METLDTREATYIWHIEKDKQELRKQLQVIDRQLSMIRNDGRQAFLESQPANFNRILHDYSDEQKGFILWKDLLMERLVWISDTIFVSLFLKLHEFFQGIIKIIDF